MSNKSDIVGSIYNTARRSYREDADKLEAYLKTITDKRRKTLKNKRKQERQNRKAGRKAKK